MNVMVARLAHETVPSSTMASEMAGSKEERISLAFLLAIQTVDLLEPSKGSNLLMGSEMAAGLGSQRAEKKEHLK